MKSFACLLLLVCFFVCVPKSLTMLLGLETKLDYFSRDLYVMFVKSSACGANEQVKAFEKTAFQFFGFRLEDWSQAKSGFEEIGLDLPELKGGETEVQLTDPKGTVLRV